MPVRRRISHSPARVTVAACAALLMLGGACASAKSGAESRGDAPFDEPTVASSEAQPARPRLAVMIVVDQFREPYLDRYGDLFTGGFRRLLDRGRLYTRASHDHAVTETAVGHATLATGVYPMRHGIVANEWQVRTPKGLVDVSNVGDSTVKIVGYPTLAGVSPHYLMRAGLADWLVAANPRSQVASVSGKDRGAVQPAAHARSLWCRDTCEPPPPPDRSRTSISHRTRSDLVGGSD